MRRAAAVGAVATLVALLSACWAFPHRDSTMWACATFGWASETCSEFLCDDWEDWYQMHSWCPNDIRWGDGPR